MKVLLALFALSMLTLPHAVQADEPPRAGFTAGGTLGLGLGCHECSDTRLFPSASLHAGWMVSPRLGVMLEGYGTYGFENRGYDTLGVVSVAGRYFLAERAWLQGSLGWARFAQTFENEFGHDQDPYVATGVAFAAGAGYEVSRGRHLAFDLALHALVSPMAWDHAEDFTAYALTLDLGLSWY